MNDQWHPRSPDRRDSNGLAAAAICSVVIAVVVFLLVILVGVMVK